MSLLLRTARRMALSLALATLGGLALAPSPALAKQKTRLTFSTTAITTQQAWMSPDVGRAWAAGFKGQYTTITVIDQFLSGTRFGGNLGTGQTIRRHGEWTSLEAAMVAPMARVATQDFSRTTAVTLATTGLNTLNLSYAMYADAGLTSAQIGWNARETSVVQYATTGRAVVVKAAGNDAVAVNTATSSGRVDYLNTSLTGTASTIFVGALSSNGTTASPASLASYSNYAGSDPLVQSHFLTVGVLTSRTGLAGTSFAAPIVSGYSAILGSKFRTATPTQITNQLLNTARTDTIAGYSADLHGRGEASLSRALAPAAIR